MSNPSSDLERIHRLETDVTVLHRDSALHTKILEKVEVNIDRAETHYEAISRAISIYDERLRVQKEINEKLEESMITIEEKVDKLMIELEEKLDIQEEKRIRYLENLKMELITRIDTIKPKMNQDIDDNADKEKFKIFKFLIDNWKILLIGISIIIGLTLHKWSLLTSILGLSG